MKYLWINLLLFCKLTNGQIEEKPTVFRVIPGASHIHWMASKPTGTHNGLVNIDGGTITVKGQQLLGGVFTLDMKSIKVSDLQGSDKQKVEGNLQGDYFFETKRYPTAQFQLVSVNEKGSSADISGKLTMHGITHGVSFKATGIKITKDGFTANATISFNRRDWQVATSNVMYNTLIYPTIQLEVHIEAQK